MDHKLTGSVLNYLCELLKHNRRRLPAEHYATGLSVLEQFRAWQEERKLSAEELYMLIICGDGDGIFEYAESDVLPGEEEIHIVWEVVLSVLMTVVRLAFEEEGTVCPQDVEIINPDRIGDFYRRIFDGKTSLAQLFDCFCREVCF